MTIPNHHCINFDQEMKQYIKDVEGNTYTLFIYKNLYIVGMVKNKGINYFLLSLFLFARIDMGRPMSFIPKQAEQHIPSNPK